MRQSGRRSRGIGRAFRNGTRNERGIRRDTRDRNLINLRQGGFFSRVWREKSRGLEPLGTSFLKAHHLLQLA